MIVGQAGSAVLLLSSVLFAAAATPEALPRCSADSFTIDGTSVAVTLCPGADAKTKADVTETLSVRGQPPYVRDVTLDLVPGAESSRAIDDAPLTKLGIARTLHLTIVYKSGTARLEHALLVPGAIALK